MRKSHDSNGTSATELQGTKKLLGLLELLRSAYKEPIIGNRTTEQVVDGVIPKA